MCKWMKNKTMVSMNDSEIMLGYVVNKLKLTDHIITDHINILTRRSTYNLFTLQAKLVQYV